MANGITLELIGETPSGYITSFVRTRNSDGKIVSETVIHKCPPHIYDNAKVIVKDGQLKTISKCAYCGFELIF